MWTNLMSIGYPFHCEMSEEYQRPISLLYAGEEPPLIDPVVDLKARKAAAEAKRKALQGRRRSKPSYNFRRRDLVEQERSDGDWGGSDDVKEVEGRETREEEKEDIEHWNEEEWRKRETEDERERDIYI